MFAKLLSPSAYQPIALFSIPIAFILYFVLSCIYNLYFHSLRRFPGPAAWRASRLPYAYHVFRGDLEKENVMGSMHAKYGKIVRIAPDTLAFADGQAHKDINGHKQGQVPNQKDRAHIGPIPKGAVRGIIVADDVQHARFRKLLSPAFNFQSLQDQQPILMEYINLLIKGLREDTPKGPIDIAAWMQWTFVINGTFDIIGDLTYAESFDGLATKSYNPWILNIFDFVKFGRCLGFLCEHVPFFRDLMPYVTPKKVKQRHAAHYSITKGKVEKRLEEGETRRPDFMTLVLRNQGKEDALTLPELIPNASTLVLAGSETTGTLLGGAIFLLSRNPDAYKSLTKEIRESFSNETEIKFPKVDKLPYLNAVLQETFRCYPPVPAGLDRIVADPAGITVAGEWVGKGTRVSVHQLASYKYEGCFHQAARFIPERWLGDPRFADDDREVVQPFSVGPRDCIGRNLAYIEMRLILSRLMYTFDVELVNKDQDWIGEQKIFGLWQKIPLMVNLRLAEGK